MAIRTYGLSGSGMDVDQMVKDMMKAQQTRYNSIQQKKTQVEWKKTDFNTMYNTVSDFRNTVFNYKLTGTTSPKQATSSDDKIVQATAAAEAANVNHTITVTQLAEGASKTSTGAISGTNAKTDLASQFGISGSFKVKLSNGGDSKEIEIKSTDSIYDVVNNINNAGINIRANYDATLDRFSIYTSNTGKNSEINFTGSSSAGMDFFKNNLKIDTATATGKNAKFSLDGIGDGKAADGTTADPADVALEQITNSFVIGGVTYNLKALGTANVTVNADNTKTIATVKSFIDAYNNTLSKLYGEINEAKYKDYLPLTDEQRSAMSESDIKAWDEKAKSGMLHNDSTLRMAVNTLRNNIASPVTSVNSKFNSFSALGITTGVYTENGKLHLNESTLQKALEADPDIVNKIFTAKGTVDADGKPIVSTEGVATRLYDTLKTTMDNISTTAGRSAGVSDDTESALAKQITSYSKQLSAFKTKMADMQKRYYAQFDAMETALNNLNKQSSWLSQQLGTK